MDEIDEIITWARTHDQAPLLLDGWDRASIWGWDETLGSLYARLWPNTDDSAKPPTITIGPGDFAPAITIPETLAQYIAMAVECSPWDVMTALDGVVDQDDDVPAPDTDAKPAEADTVVTITEAYGICWPTDPTKTSAS